MLADVGTPVRYRGLGAGVVVGHSEREFRGSARTFAIIQFPHRDMKAQVPLGDPGVESKLASVAPARTVRGLIKSIASEGGRLMRTWEEREKVATKRLREGGPEQWTELLRDYAFAQRAGLQLAVSDVEVIREAQEMLASELACSASEDYVKVLGALRLTYGKAAVPELAELVS